MNVIDQLKEQLEVELREQAALQTQIERTQGGLKMAEAAILDLRKAIEILESAINEKK